MSYLSIGISQSSTNSFDDAFSTWHEGAVISIESIGGKLVRPACFVYSTSNGFAWVESSIDGADVMHYSLHQRMCSLYPRGFGFVGHDDLKVTYSVLPCQTDCAELEVRQRNADFLNWLHFSGKTWGVERNRVMSLFFSQLSSKSVPRQIQA